MGAIISSLFNKLFSGKPMKVVMVGLDAAGKTTILYKLKLGRTITTVPTIGFNVETVDYKNTTFTVYDLNAQAKSFPLWRYHFPNTNGLIFVIDSSDRERLSQAKEELYRIFWEDELTDSAFLIFANKQDLPESLSIDELTNELELHVMRNHRWYIQPCCATEGHGLYEGLEWLSNKLVK